MLGELTVPVVSLYQSPPPRAGVTGADYDHASGSDRVDQLAKKSCRIGDMLDDVEGDDGIVTSVDGREVRANHVYTPATGFIGGFWLNLYSVALPVWT